MVGRLLMHPVVEDVFNVLTVALTLLSAGLIASLLIMPPAEERRVVPAARSVAAPMAAARISMMRSCKPVSGAFPRPSRVDCKP
ncbi:hypothetical protein SAMN02745126_03384 [Enhydrobacter aerosaccus]|uniref:Uncharacterized protein n=1 Tax=Enhydrobacter aerosaccus TaxID=225324 RepID=A0A1T4QS35_9HYPH|nr:hypothetical protein [Enhydrobacter aerosaccus]SKA06068.1 hypothetical protein SAMN02745126_03384 [Enhydrobacter aerosaccus]